MNSQLQNFARQSLRDGLAQLPEDWQKKFKWMYARNGGKRSLEDAEAMPIDAVVDEVPGEKLDWAMQQVENSLRKLQVKA